jgi:hypothetical protein
MFLWGMLFVLVLILSGLVYLFAEIVVFAASFIFRGQQNIDRWKSLARYIVYFVSLVFFVFTGYRIVHPSDKQFLSDFSRVALRDVPSSAQVVAKSANVFYLHGDEYCAYSRIRLSSQDYSRLKSEIQNDQRFKVGLEMESDVRNEALLSTRDISIQSIYVRYPAERYQKNQTLIFLSDLNHIDVNAC